MTITFESSSATAPEPAAALPGQMRAVRFHGPDLLPRMETLPLPRPRPGQALVRVLAAGVCHTELQLLSGTLNPGVWPLTPGHEIVGEVVTLPGDARPGEMQVGQRVLVYYGQPCRACAWCLAGQEQVCPNSGPQPGLTTDGGFAEYVRVPVEALVPLPDHLDPAEAAPLGCAAATAYHAVHGVAGVQAGETVVVTGIGGVGLALVQIARLAGARVIGIGRSPEKLALAAELGAEVVDASPGLGAGNPSLAVRRLTDGDGAHAVFDLVGSAATLAAATTMVRRRGQVVLVGYGTDRLSINPLHLVLREIRLAGSLGSTRAELVKVVQLAASGHLRVPVAQTLPLESAGEALAALRAGEVTGRAVLLPALAPRASVPNAPSRATVTERAERPSSAPAAIKPEERPKAEPAPVLPAAEPRGEDGSPPLEAELMAFVRRGIDAPLDHAAFDRLARRLFSYQFARNAPYRAFCERRGVTPTTVHHWQEIPAVPIAAFKETLLACEPLEGAVEFNSSGTTRPEHKSRHFHPGLRLYDLNARLNFKAHVLPDRERLRWLVLYPPRVELPNSSLAHWLSLMVESFGLPGSDWYVHEGSGLDAERLVADLRQAQADDEPVGVLGASFGLVHFLEHCVEHDQRFHLPAGSRVMDTGGYKGRSREYPKAELYGMVMDRLGVPDQYIVNMYGMTEHGTQFLDGTLRRALEGVSEPSRAKVVPPWARTLVVDPLTLAPMPDGQRGLLLHVDLINRASALAVLTEDVGYALGSQQFELLGRAEGTEARGCSIALDELIAAVGGPP